jgi:hypothetical protein
MLEKKLRCKCGIHAISSRPSIVTSQIIAGIEVKCINHEHGCNERMTLGTLANHLKVCKGVIMNCYQCGLLMVRGLLESHLLADCPFRWVTCQHCDESIMSCQMNGHLITRTPISHYDIDSRGEERALTDLAQPSCIGMITCPNGCSLKLIPRKDIHKHAAVCPLSAITCSICKIECTRSSMIQHMNDNTQQHTTIMMSTINEKVASLTTEMTSLTKENKELRSRVESMERLVNQEY